MDLSLTLEAGGESPPHYTLLATLCRRRFASPHLRRPSTRPFALLPGHCKLDLSIRHAKNSALEPLIRHASPCLLIMPPVYPFLDFAVHEIHKSTQSMHVIFLPFPSEALEAVCLKYACDQNFTRDSRRTRLCTPRKEPRHIPHPSARASRTLFICTSST